MATGNGDQTRNNNMSRTNTNSNQNNKNTLATYKVYGTNEPYSGRVVQIGSDLFTTEGGALEGFSYQVVPINVNKNPLQEPNLNPSNNPVIRTFINRYDATNVSEYLNSNGTPLARGAKLHEHQNGQVMKGHDPNNMGEVVTLNPLFGRTDSNPNIPPIGTGGNTTSRGSSNNNNQVMIQPRDPNKNYDGGSSY